MTPRLPPTPDEPRATAGGNPAAAIALHRFALGGPDLAVVGDDPQAWLIQQIGPADPYPDDTLPHGDAALAMMRQQYRERRTAVTQGNATALREAARSPAVDTPGEIEARDLRLRLAGAATSTRPFAERLALFWANHFTVSSAKFTARGLVGSFERDAIRPHVAGRFETMLQAVVRHPAMLLYLDNHRSAGPNSPLARRGRAAAARRNLPTGLNENLAREVLELHTLGVARADGSGGGYTQADVTEFAKVLTGWRPDEGRGSAVEGEFEPDWHEPGPKTVLGRRYDEGPQALQQVLADLARNPHTGRFLAFKMARHFVADEPPAALVQRMAEAYERSRGDLSAMTRALVESPLAWQATAQKLKTPEEFVVSSVRLLQLGGTAFQRPPDGGIGRMGQKLHYAPSPAGWSDQAADWLGPEALWQRVEWASRTAERHGGAVDARELARRSLGPRLSEATRVQIARAADGPQALALLLMSPEFQRR